MTQQEHDCQIHGALSRSVQIFKCERTTTSKSGSTITDEHEGECLPVHGARRNNVPVPGQLDELTPGCARARRKWTPLVSAP